MTERNRQKRTKDAPYPTDFTNARFVECMRTPHDVGGEDDVPMEFEEKEEEVWEHNTFVTCEVLAWRGVWNAEERRRRQNVDLGNSNYLAIPYYGRWLLTAARILIDKQHVTLTELIEKMDEVKKRYE
jgi:hypothetical protein